MILRKSLRVLQASLASAALLPFAASAAHAQETDATVNPPANEAVEGTGDSARLSEIIVTGTKTGAQNLQSTPAAVSVVDSQLLESQGLATIQDVAAYVPNLTYSRNTGAALIFIRGIGSNNAGAGSDPSVTQQIDGVYIARASAQLSDFFDVERIEVLRGPQGTLYGRNAVGGTINVISRGPSDSFGGRVRVGYGNYDNRSAEGYVTGPLAKDALTGSLALSYREHDPFFNNIVPGFEDVGSAKRFGARAQLRYEAGDNFDFTLRGDYSLLDEYYDSFDHLLRPVPFNAPLANSLVGSYRDIAINVNQKIRTDAGGVSGEANWRFGEGFSLKSITAYRRSKSRTTNDNDATDLFVSHATFVEDDKAFSQEFNLNYNADRLKAVAGLYYFGDTDFQSNRSDNPPSIATPPPRSFIAQASPTVKTRSYAAFAQANLEVVRDLTVIVGARYTTESKTIDQTFLRTSLNPATLGASLPGFPALFTVKRRDKAFTPKFGIDFQATDDVFFYASATRGFKSGGFNNAAASAATAGFNPEKIWSYEAGVKTQFLDRRIRLNLTGFIYDYTDLQVRQFLGPGNAVISNAASAKVKGFEAELLAKPFRDVQFTANVSVLDAKYRKFPTAPVAGGFAPFIPNQTCVPIAPPNVCTIDASGNHLDNAPKYSGLLALDYTPKIGDYDLSAHLDYTWRSRVFYDPSNIPLASQPKYGLFNANIGFGPSEKGWKIESYIRNITNEKYYVIVAGNGFTPGAIAGDPRTYGVRVGYSW